MTDKKDIVLRCIDCNNEFIWTAAQQVYFEERELHAPKRCVSCRKIKREEIARKNGQQSS